MSSVDETKKDQHNEFEEAVYRSEQFFVKHFKTLAIAFAAIVVLVVGFFAYRYFISGPKEVKASEALIPAEEAFIQEQDSLSLYGAGLASKGTEAIAKEYKGTDAANLAHAYSGIALYDQGKYKEALEELKAFSSKEQYVAPSLLRLMGDCQVQLGALDAAVKLYKEAAQKADNMAISPSCLAKAGRVLEKQGKISEALALYREAKDKYLDNSVEADILRAEAKAK